MSVTATYSVLGSSGTRTWFALGFVGSSLYGADPSTGIYLLDASSGAETFKRSEQINFRGLSAFNGALASVAYGSYARAFSTSSFTTVSYNWASAYGGAWFDICDAGTYAYAIKYEGGATNQIGKFASDGSVTYGTTANRAYTGIVYLNGYLYASVDGGQVYKIDPTTWAETVLANSPSLAWRGLTTDGTYLYSANYGGYLYRISPVDGTYEQLLGDSTVRNWQNVAYYNGSVYACIYNGQVWKITLPVAPVAPTASLITSTINNNANVTLSCSTSGAVIKYTTDGTVPNDTNGTVYSSAITIAQTTTLKIASLLNGYVTQGSTYTYTYVCSDPTLDAKYISQKFLATFSLSVSKPSTTSTIYYTLDGSTPTTASNVYTAPISISDSVNVKFIAIKTGCTSSAVISRVYTKDVPFLCNYLQISQWNATIGIVTGIARIDNVLYVANSSGNIYTLNESTGVYTLWVSTGRSGCNGLAEYNGRLVSGHGSSPSGYIRIYNVSTKALIIEHNVNTYPVISITSGYAACNYSSDSSKMAILTYSESTFSAQLYSSYPTANKAIALLNGVKYTVGSANNVLTYSGSTQSVAYSAGHYTTATKICTDGNYLFTIGNSSTGTTECRVYSLATGATLAVVTLPIAYGNIGACSYFNGSIYFTETEQNTTGGVHRLELRNIITGRYIFNNGYWKFVNSFYTYNSGAWKLGTELHERIQDTWTRVL